MTAFASAQRYDESARVQQQSAAALINRISEAFIGRPPPNLIVEIGCGTGFLTKLLRACFPHATIIATDLTHAMACRAREKVPDALFGVMDAERLAFAPPVDLICGNLCLQWFDDRKASLRDLALLLRPGGSLFVTTLSEGSFSQWHDACKKNGSQGGFPYYPSMRELADDFPLCGTGEWTVTPFDDSPQSGLTFLRELRHIGAHTPRASFQPFSAGKLRQTLKAFDKGARTITYQIAFGHFRRCKGFFISGTDTDVGKTFVSALIAQHTQATYWKPLQTGTQTETADTLRVIELAALAKERVICTQIRLKKPLSPYAAAKIEGVDISRDQLRIPSHAHAASLIVEGAGGLLVPISSDFLMIDLIGAYAMPVILVARSGLGTINHTLLSIEALRARKLSILGIILNGPQDKLTAQIIREFSKVPILAQIPVLQTLTPASLAAEAARHPSFAAMRAYLSADEGDTFALTSAHTLYE